MIVVVRGIGASPDAVWACMSELERWDELLPTFDAVERVGESGPVGVGVRFRVRQPGLAAAEYEVTDWRPGAGFTWEASSPGVRTVAAHDLRPDGAGTRLELGVSWHGPGAWLARLLFSRKAKGFIEREAETFARLAEG